MIQIEYLNDGSLVKHYSDAGYLLLQNETGNKYSEPLDAMPCRYTYTETDELVDGDIIDGNEEISSDEFMAMIDEVL